jgi:hypothetical protein
VPTNRIRIVSDETGVTCKIWDKDGTKYNVSDIFMRIRDQVTMGILSTESEVDFKHGTNALKANLKFRATKKDIKYDVDESVIAQILALGGTEE